MKNSEKNSSLEKYNLKFRIRSLFYLLKQDKKLKLTKYFLKRPLKLSFNLIKSYRSKKPYALHNGMYLFNSKSFGDIHSHIKNKDNIKVFGFSYCMKPKKCPSERFSDKCQNDLENPICKSCFIGKCKNLQKDPNVIFLIIPDAYYISDQLLQIKSNEPKKELIFVIMSCQYSINMFSDLANALKMKGLGLELNGRVCMNRKSFLYAERGIKNSTTLLNLRDKQMIFDFLRRDLDKS